MLSSGENERQEQASAPSTGRDEGLGAAAGREDQGDPADVAADHRASLVRQPQHLHPRLRRLQVSATTSPPHTTDPEYVKTLQQLKWSKFVKSRLVCI